jgi:hypothetical protein
VQEVDMNDEGSAARAIDDVMEGPAHAAVGGAGPADGGAWTPPLAAGTAAGALLDRRGALAWSAVAGRLGAALGLAATFGIAIGLRRGGLDLVRHGLGVPLGLVTVAALAAPALPIALLHAGVRVEALPLADALSRAAATAGLLLAGMAPLAALLAVTCEASPSVAAFAWLALAVAGVFGLRGLARELDGLFAHEAAPRRSAARLSAFGFAAVGALLAARVWSLALPLLAGGAS